MKYNERPIDPTPAHTADLPPTPLRDRNIPATAWIEAPGVEYTMRLFPDGTAQGVGPSGTTHDRFRAWKEDLRDA